jgi:hypothetical protein
MKALSTKMVLKRKASPSQDSAPVYKARLCGKGFLQIHGVDYFSTFSAVATYNTIRAFVGVLATLDYEIDTVDVITAFLLAPLKEEIYIKIPDGYPNAAELRNAGMVLRLLKSLYGLKQAPHDWNQEIHGYLLYLGFMSFSTDRCVYVGQFMGVTCYILLYVDDMILGTPN